MKFDITKDNKYPCFCQACLVGKRQDEMSQKDIRYCLECQRLVEYEYSLLADKSHSKRYKPVKPEANFKAIESPNVDMGTGKENSILSTSNEKLAKVDKIKPSPTTRGRKKKGLPEELIKQLQGKGMGSKAIATKLKEQGIDVSYKTVQRFLARINTG